MLRARRCIYFAVLIVVYFSLATGDTQTTGAGDNYLKHSLTAGFMAEARVGSRNSNLYLPNAPGFSVNYSYRPGRWLALEAGLEQVPHAVGSSVCCRYFESVDDQLYLIPFGARYVWEPERSRMRFSMGGGGAYVKRTIPQDQAGATYVYPFSGWGGQFVVSGDYRLTRSGRFRIGVTGRYYYVSAKPSMPSVYGSGAESLHFVTIGPAFTFSFR